MARFPALPWAVALLLTAPPPASGQEGERPDRPPRDNPPASEVPALVDRVDYAAADQQAHSFDKGLRRSLRFDPLLALNPNRGELRTAIDLQLPPNRLAMRLRLEYNHADPVNRGLGYGWSWGLPEIRPNSRLRERTPFETSGVLGSGELTEVGEDLAPLADRLAAITRQLDLPPAGLRFAPYRPMVDESGTLFVHLLRGQDSAGWIALLLDGSYWAFDPHGRAVLRGDASGPEIRLRWADGLLAEVAAADWRTELDYLPERQTYPRFVADRWLHLPAGLLRVTHRSGPHQRSLRFGYEAGYLRLARWDGAFLPTFQARYEEPSLDEAGEPNDLARHDDRHFLRSSRSAPVEWRRQGAPGKATSIFVDLNGDGRSDEVVFDWAEMKRRSEHQLDSYDWLDVEDDVEDFDRWIARQHLRTEVRIAVVSAPGEAVERRRDESYDLPAGVDPVKYRARLDDDEIATSSVTQGLFFVDLNGDDLADLVSCPGAEELSANRNVASRQGERERVHSHLFLTALSWFAPEKVRGYPHLRDPARIAGGPAVVYLQANDEKKVAAALDQHHASALLGVNRWQRVAGAPFQCHQETVFFDADRDGRWDILAGDTLYLNGSHGRAVTFAPVKVDVRSLFESPGRAIDLAETDHQLLDLDRDGLLELRQSRGTTYDPASDRTLLFTTGTTRALALPPWRKLLASFESAFGGRISVRYAPRGERWVVATIEENPNAGGPPAATPQPLTTRTFSYLTPLHDPYFGLFLGFAEVDETLASESRHQAARIVRRNYTRDVDPQAVLYRSRGRLNGQLQHLSVRAALAAKPLWVRTFEKPAVQPLADSRLWFWYGQLEEAEFDEGSDHYSRFLKTRVSFPVWHRDARGEPLFPLEKQVVKEGRGLPSPVSDALLESVSRSREVRAFDPRLYFSGLVLSAERDRDGAHYRPDLRIRYRTGTALPEEVCRGERCATLQHDPLGRIASGRTATGLDYRISYVGSGPLVESLASEAGQEVRAYAPLTDWLARLETALGGVWHRRFTPDGTLVEVTVRRQEDGPETRFYEAQLAPLQCQEHSCASSRSLELFADGARRLWRLDGFGRIVNTATFYSGQPHWSGDRFYLDGERVFRRQAPGGREHTPQIEWQAWFDPLQRPREEVTLGGSRIAYRYFDGCEIRTVQGVQRFATCLSDFGRPRRFERGSEVDVLEVAATGEVLGSPSHGADWERSPYGEILASASRGGGLQAPPWQRRTVAFSPDGLKATSESGRTWQKNAYDRIVAAGKEHPGPGDTTESWRYEAGVLRQHDLQSAAGELLWQTRFEYDGLGYPSRIDHGAVVEEIRYDPWSRVEARRFENGVELSPRYDGGQVAALAPLLRAVRYTPARRLPFEIEYAGGLVVRLSYFPDSDQLRTVQVLRADGTLLWAEGRERNPQNQIVARTTRSPATAPGGGQLVRETFAYDPATYQLVFAGRPPVRRDPRGRVPHLADTPLGWTDENLTEVGETRLVYDNFGALVGACPRTSPPRLGAPDCFFRLDRDTVLVGGEPIRLVRLGERPVAVLVGATAFPVVADPLGSVRLLLNPEGTAVLWERSFDAWGRKRLRLGAHLGPEERTRALDLERKVVWSYASLIEVPMELGGAIRAGGEPLYLSASRAYSPLLGEWLSVDPLAAWSPDLLLERPGNWDAVRYCGNDPLARTDPTGTSIPGDVWLYRGDGTFSSDAAAVVSNMVDLKSGPYTHASVEIKGSRQYTAVGKGAFVIIDNQDILTNKPPNEPRIIDIYRHKDHKNFNADAATQQAEQRAQKGVQRTGLWGKPYDSNKYLFDGYCSQRPQETLETGGLKLGNHGISTPNDFARDPNFELVETYDTSKQQQTPAPKR